MADFDTTVNRTTPTAGLFVGYTDDPNGRGTPSLIISCVLTLVLCVWSALHLNVPPQNQTKAQTIWLNTRWIVTGIYAPELVVFTAWRQWSSAKILQKLVQDILKDDQRSHPGKRQMEWTMAHSFFACTGGFAFELEGMRKAISEVPGSESQKVRRLTITGRGIALLARYGRLPYVEKEEIEDKSKANDLAKATVIVQATWMLIQVIGRLAFKLPVTVLEVNTVAHVLCAFAMYLFWWNKPLLPNEPIVIRDEAQAPLAALMYSSSEASGYVSPDRMKSQTIIKALIAHLSLYSKVPEVETICLRASAPHPVQPRNTFGKQVTITKKSIITQDEQGKANMVLDPFTVFQHTPASCLAELQAKREKEQGTAFFERKPRVVDERPVGDGPSVPEETRWSLIKGAFQKDNDLFADRVMLMHSTDGHMCCHLKSEQLIADHIQNWPSNDLLRNVDGLIVGMVLWLANFCYGGIHAAAWNDHFPSSVEKWFWRASSSYIGFCGGLWVILNFLVTKYPRLNEFWEHWMDGEKNWLESVGLGIVVFICGFSLLLARVFIVVEAFISIRELPKMAYQTPQWTNVFPHF